jgi:hypothetical protein
MRWHCRSIARIEWMLALMGQQAVHPLLQIGDGGAINQVFDHRIAVQNSPSRKNP